jgi:hypothetical protein
MATCGVDIDCSDSHDVAGVATAAAVARMRLSMKFPY